MSSSSIDFINLEILSSYKKNQYNILKKIKYIIAKKYFMSQIKKGNSLSMYYIGLYYNDIKNNYLKANKYFLMATNKGNTNAMFSLGYNMTKVNNKESKKFYLMAIDNNCINSMYNIGSDYYFIYNDYDNAKKYYLMYLLNCIKNNIINIHNLVHIHFNKDDLNIIINNIYEYRYISYAKNLEYKLNYNNWCYIKKLINLDNIKYKDIELKINNFLKIMDCDICFEENKDCIPVNICMHYICIDCYYKLNINKCPFCRLDLDF